MRLTLSGESGSTKLDAFSRKRSLGRGGNSSQQTSSSSQHLKASTFGNLSSRSAIEAAGIFPIAAENNVEALAICTVSDDIVTGDALSSDERQTTFDEMILVALETVVA